MQLQEAVEELQRLHQNSAYLRKLKLLRSYLRIVIVGFFLWRDIEQRISKNEEKRNSLLKGIAQILHETLDSFRKQIDQIEKSYTYLPRDDEKRLLDLLGTLETDLNYLVSKNAL